MSTAITDFFEAVGFVTVCVCVMVGFAYVTAAIDVYLTEKKLMKMKKMEKKINEKV